MKDEGIAFTYQSLPAHYYNQLESYEVELIFDFFIVYSRIEFTLKKIGIRKVGDDNRVFPNWKKYCNLIGERFNKNRTSQLCRAYDYYLTQPPMIQVVRNDALDWMPNERGGNESEFAWVIRSIGIVRNNLFHGGKFPLDQARDTDLLGYGLAILYECLELDNYVNEVFINERNYRGNIQ